LGALRTLLVAPEDNVAPLAFLLNKFGKPYTAKGLSNAFKKWCAEAGLPHCSAHSVRKGTLTRIAERGAASPTRSPRVAVTRASAWLRFTPARLISSRSIDRPQSCSGTNPEQKCLPCPLVETERRKKRDGSKPEKTTGDPGRIRTCNPLLRRQMLYPLSYGTTVLVRQYSSKWLSFNASSGRGDRT
jgi:hypothetical protein